MKKGGREKHKKGETGEEKLWEEKERKEKGR